MRFFPRAALGLPVLVAGLGAPALHAEETASVTARLDWQQGPGGEGCLDGKTLEAAVNARWGRHVFVDAPSADILLSGTIGHTNRNEWSAVLVLRRADGTSLGSREIVTAAQDCSSLDDSVSLAVGLMLDVSRQRIVQERRLAQEQARTPPAPIDGPPISIPKETLSPREPFRVAPSIGGETAIGLLPGWGVAARVGLSVLPPRFVLLEAAVALWAPGDEHAEGGRGARFSAWTVELALCPFSFRSGRTRLDSCLSERFGQIRATGFGFAESATAREPLSLVGVREVATFRVATPLALFLGVGVEVPFVRYRFVFGSAEGGARAIYRMPPAVGSLALGLSLEW